MALVGCPLVEFPGGMVSVQPPVQEQPRPDGARATILRVSGLLSLAICCVGISALVASGVAAVGTRVHYVAGLAPLVSLVIAGVTLLAGRVSRTGSRLTAAKVALGLDLTFYIVAFVVVLAMVQNIDG
jgi:hypothetical protein